jgi:hypothetical protein
VDLSKSTQFFLAIITRKLRWRCSSLSFGRLGRGEKAIQAGNPEFNELYKIKTNDEAKALEVIDSVIQSKILRLKKPERFNAVVKKGRVWFDVPRAFLGEMEELKSILDILIDLTKKIENLFPRNNSFKPLQSS